MQLAMQHMSNVLLDCNTFGRLILMKGKNSKVDILNTTFLFQSLPTSEAGETLITREWHKK